MLSRENNVIRDDRETGNVLDPGMLIDEFWQTTVETASPAEIGSHCGHFLRAWNFLAIERMETEGRLTPADLATAKNSLRRFVQLMKTERACHSPAFWAKCRLTTGRMTSTNSSSPAIALSMKSFSFI
jgi:hypothetical protein